jgi:site-specific DNA-cytosine methylase
MTEFPPEYINYLKKIKERGITMENVEELILEKNKEGQKTKENPSKMHVNHGGVSND